MTRTASVQPSRTHSPDLSLVMNPTEPRAGAWEERVLSQPGFAGLPGRRTGGAETQQRDGRSGKRAKRMQRPKTRATGTGSGAGEVRLGSRHLQPMPGFLGTTRSPNAESPATGRVQLGVPNLGHSASPKLHQHPLQEASRTRGAAWPLSVSGCWTLGPEEAVSTKSAPGALPRAGILPLLLAQALLLLETSQD